MIPSSDREPGGQGELGPAAPPRTAAFRATMALLATGVTVVTAADPVSGRPRGMTANAVMSVSLAPPLIVVSVRRIARLHEAIRRAGSYAVTVLGETQWPQALRFAGMTSDQGPEPVFTERSGVPVLRHGLAWIVARLVQAHPAGDHTLFVGEVTDHGGDRPGDPPLAFHRSAFARLAPLAMPSAAPIPALPTWEKGVDMWG